MSATSEKTFSHLPCKTAYGMKIALAFLLAIAVETGWAQPQDAAEFQRASTTQRLSEFPKIAKDGRVWFQFKAPNAQKVQLKIGATNKTYDMEKLADGTWNLVIPYPGPGFQLYWMIVDGLNVMDPGSETFFSNGIKTAVEVPSPGEDFYDLKPVPHGHVLQHWFYSQVTQAWRRMYVYLPRTMIPARTCAIRSSTCSTATVKTKPSGRMPDAPSSFLTT